MQPREQRRSWCLAGRAQRQARSRTCAKLLWMGAGRDCHGLRFVRRLVIDDVVHLDPRGRALAESTLGALSKDLRLFYVTLKEIRLRDCRVCIGLFALPVVGVS